MIGAFKRALALAGIGAAIIVFTLAFRVQRSTGPRLVYATLGELSAVHARVQVAGLEVRGARRFGSGESIETSADGRARARLDDGTSIVIDRSTKLTATNERVTLEAGRLFVRGTPGGRTEIGSGSAVVLIGGSTVAVERVAPGDTQFYCVAGEIVARVSGKEVRVHGGETGHVHADTIVVTPETAWNDWTRGMAHPWSASGKPRAAIGELWGRAVGGADEGGSPLAVRSHDVLARIEGEVATTETRTTYFNAGGTALTGDFRMALPPGAIVSGFATGSGETVATGDVHLANDTEGDRAAPTLEWAGEGWLRGKTEAIQPGQTATVVVRYVEWLSPAGSFLTYRYPMIADATPPRIGEFHAAIDVSGVDPAAIGLGPGMSIHGDTIEVRHADFTPSSDLVVDLTQRPGAVGPARAYLVPASDPSGSDGEATDSFLLVRTEVQPREPPGGVSLALVVDTSRSIAVPLLDAERGLVEALLEGLGPEDNVVVFAADDTVTPVGPAALGPVDDARRVAVRHALSDLHPGGATDIGLALERAADALPTGGGPATLLYIGDGWPTLGDATVEAIRARLSRRTGGVPRLGAVAVGPTANRFGLTALVRGAGPVVDIADRDAAAQVAVQLLAEGLRPSVAGVEVDLGPDVDRVYPRGGQTLRAGDTLTTVGRTRGGAPRSVQVRYRDGRELRTTALPVSTLPGADAGDIRRRWAAARVEELMLRGEGREVVIDSALRNGLMTPWTGWAVGLSPGASFAATPLAARLLDAGLDGSFAVFSARFATQRPLGGALTAPRDDPWPAATDADEAALKRAIDWSARRTLDDALGSIRQCRDSRASLRPEAFGALQVRLSLGSDGHVRDTSVSGATPSDDDRALDRCAELVIRNLNFYSIGVGSGITLTYEFHLAPARETKAHVCSPTSTLPAPMRRGIWFERLKRPDSDENPLGARGERAYFHAKDACELPTWSDRRTFLELLLELSPDGAARVDLASRLDEGGDNDAASLVRREAVRRVQTPAELEAVRRALLASEPDVIMPFVHAYARSGTDVARLAVVQAFLRLAPHDSRLRRRELSLLESLDRKPELVSLSTLIRDEPFLDAGLLGDTASMLRRIGRDEEARKTFGELAERAPEIPFARAFLGDRLLDEERSDEAALAYETLLRLVPDDPGASLRLALAHAGAGRLDIALRLLAHVTETGGRTSDPALQDLASMLSGTLIAGAREGTLTAEDGERLHRRALDVPVSTVSALVLIRAPTWVPGLRAFVARGPGGTDVSTAAMRAPSLGLLGLRVERGEGAIRLRVGRQADLLPSRAAVAHVAVLAFDHDGDLPRLITKDIPLRRDGEDVELTWTGAALL